MTDTPTPVPEDLREEYRIAHGYDAPSGPLVRTLIERIAQAEARNKALVNELRVIQHEAAGHGWGHYGYYRGKSIVLNESHLERIDAAIAESGRAVGALLTDDVSSEFLTHVPAEVEAVMRTREHEILKTLRMFDAKATECGPDAPLKIRLGIDDLSRDHEAELAAKEKEHLQTIDERDKAEDALSQAYCLVTGSSPEWSNLFGYDQAIEDIKNGIIAREQDLRPVSDEEWPQKQLEHFSFPKYGPARSLTRQDVDALLAARRAAAGEKKGKIESS